MLIEDQRPLACRLCLNKTVAVLKICPNTRVFLILVDQAASESSISMLESLIRLSVAELPARTSFS
jgi:hypothetical protein